MKQLILYYSHSGNNEKLAKYIAKRYHIDSEQIKEKREKRTMFTTVLDFLFNRKPKLQPLDKSLANYDRVIIIAPIWMGKLSSPMVSALHQYKDAIKEFAFVTFSGDPSESEKKFIPKMEAIVGKNCSFIKGFAITSLFSSEQKIDGAELMKFQANETQISSFTPELDMIFA